MTDFTKDELITIGSLIMLARSQGFYDHNFDSINCKIYIMIEYLSEEKNMSDSFNE